MIEKFDLFIEKIAVALVIFCVFSMLILSVASIMLRQFDLTFLWLEPLVRHLVFFSTFLGASIAVGEGQHIKIDLVSRILEAKKMEKWAKPLDILILIFTIIASVIILKSSLDLVHLELEESNTSFWNIETGHLIAIISVGMTLILLRLVMRLLKRIVQKEEL